MYNSSIFGKIFYLFFVVRFHPTTKVVGFPAHEIVIVSGKTINYRKKKKLNLRLIIQAGPTLISNGYICVQTKKEKFRSDVAKITRQLSIGITSNHKTIVMYSYAWKLGKIAQQLKSKGCIFAIKLDGGSMAALRFRPFPDDKISPHIYVGNHDYLPLQISFR